MGQGERCLSFTPSRSRHKKVRFIDLLRSYGSLPFEFSHGTQRSLSLPAHSTSLSATSPRTHAEVECSVVLCVYRLSLPPFIILSLSLLLPLHLSLCTYPHLFLSLILSSTASSYCSSHCLSLLFTSICSLYLSLFIILAFSRVLVRLIFSLVSHRSVRRRGLVVKFTCDSVYVKLNGSYLYITYLSGYLFIYLFTLIIYLFVFVSGMMCLSLFLVSLLILFFFCLISINYYSISHYSCLSAPPFLSP